MSCTCRTSLTKRPYMHRVTCPVYGPMTLEDRVERMERKVRKLEYRNGLRTVP